MNNILFIIPTPNYKIPPHIQTNTIIFYQTDNISFDTNHHNKVFTIEFQYFQDDIHNFQLKIQAQAQSENKPFHSLFYEQFPSFIVNTLINNIYTNLNIQSYKINP